MKSIDFSRYFWRTDLITLRAMRDSDWEDHYASRFDSEARRFLQYELELPPTEANEKADIGRFSDFSAETPLLMFVIEDAAGKAVGGLNLSRIDERNGSFSMGLQVYPDERGKGYGTAASTLLLEYAFFERRLHKFNATILEGNTASGRLLAKLGCRKEGTRREVVYMNGKYLDEILYGLTEREYETARKKNAVQARADRVR